MAQAVSDQVERFGAVGTAVAFVEGTGVQGIDESAAFEVGATPEGLVDALKTIGAKPVNGYRGVFGCSLCAPMQLEDSGPWAAAGLGPFEIHIWTDDGDLFVAPNLIVHFIETHSFKPPDSFIEAALSVAGSDWRCRRGRVAEALDALLAFPEGSAVHGQRLAEFCSGLEQTRWYAVDGWGFASATDAPRYLRAAMTGGPASASPAGEPLIERTWSSIRHALEDDPSIEGVTFSAGVDVSIGRSLLT